MDDSMGSSVKLTNSETSTATATVMPNCRKNLPITPLMKATGMNTARMANVVAMTARPISEVPSSDAARWLLPMSAWRTMFSRTTMASSMRRPMHSDNAISVMKFSEKPNAFSAMNVAITEIGSVRPVMMVERHECRNRKTMRIVSRAPSTIVSLTRSSEPSMNFASDHMVRILMSDGEPAFEILDRLINARADFDDVRLLNLEDLERHGAKPVHAGDRPFLGFAVDDVRDLMQIDGRTALIRDDDPFEGARIAHLAFDANDLLLCAARDAACRQILIRGLNRRDDLVDADAVALQLLGTQEHLHLPLDGAADDDVPDAIRVLQTFDDLLVDDRRDLPAESGSSNRRRGSPPAARSCRYSRARSSAPSLRAAWRRESAPPCRALPAQPRRYRRPYGNRSAETPRLHARSRKCSSRHQLC